MNDAGASSLHPGDNAAALKSHQEALQANAEVCNQPHFFFSFIKYIAFNIPPV